MKKYIYLFKNIGLLTISNFSTKILGFLLVPLYTSILSTEDYGTYDIFNTTIMLLIPILTVGLIESVLRFPLSERENKEKIYIIGTRYVLYGFFLLVFICIINYIFSINMILKAYSLLFIVMYFTAVFSQLLQNYARGIEKIKSLAISSFFSSVTVLSLNIWFLVYLHLGLVGYFLASIIGMTVTIMYLVLALDVWKYRIISHKVDKKLEKRMLNYSIPTIANSISWWANNAADRYIVIFLFGLATNGIYSVSYKIPSIMTVFQSIFNQAWTISAVQEFDSNDKDGFYKTVYKMTNISMTIICSLLIMSDKILAFFLYKDQFYYAWQYVPFLLISVLFGTLCGVIGGVFTAVKDSKKLGISTTIGAIVNIVFGIILSIFIGPMGAAVGTAISYIVVWILRVIESKKYINIEINLFKDSFCYILLFIQAMCLIAYSDKAYGYFIQIVIFILICMIYVTDARKILKREVNE